MESLKVLFIVVFIFAQKSDKIQASIPSDVYVEDVCYCVTSGSCEDSSTNGSYDDENGTTTDEIVTKKPSRRPGFK